MVGVWSRANLWSVMVTPSCLFENSGWDAGWKSCGGEQTCQASTVLRVLLSWLCLWVSPTFAGKSHSLLPAPWAHEMGTIGQFFSLNPNCLWWGDRASGAGSAPNRTSNSKEHTGPGTRTSSPPPSLVKDHAHVARQWLRNWRRAQGWGGRWQWPLKCLWLIYRWWVPVISKTSHSKLGMSCHLS